MFCSERVAVTTSVFSLVFTNSDDVVVSLACKEVEPIAIAIAPTSAVG